MLVVLTETYCNKVNIQITQRDDFIQSGQLCITLPHVPRGQSCFMISDIFMEFSSCYTVCGTAHCLTPGEYKYAHNYF